MSKPARPESTTAVVVLRMEDLSAWTIERVAKMPREPLRLCDRRSPGHPEPT